MRVLVAHNFYSSANPSGENSAVVRDVGLLRNRGHDVRTCYSSSDEIDFQKVVRAAGGIRSRQSRKAIEDVFASGWKPEVFHFHNLFPLLTTSVLRAARRRKIPCIQTVHNYRRTCAAGTHFRNGLICERCTGHLLPWPAVVHGCYRGSAVQTLPVVTNQVLDRGILRDLDGYIVLTDYMSERLRGDGVNSASIFVRPTYVADRWNGNTSIGSDLLYVGRLSEEKGILRLVEAWRLSRQCGQRTLRIVGTGPLEARVREVTENDPSIEMLGLRSGEEVYKLLCACAILALPSLWYEGFPTVVAEAFSLAKPVIACDTPNARTFLFGAAWLSGSSKEDLARTIDNAFSDEVGLIRRSALAREAYEAHMTEDASYARLIDAYGSAIGIGHGRS